MAKPVEIIIGGYSITGYTSMQLSRQKKSLTGSLTLHFFWGYVPDRPVLTSATPGADVQVLIGGHVAFTGTLDKRTGGKPKSQTRDNRGRFESKGGPARSVSVGKDHYTVTLTARGKSKHLVTSSHQHPTTNMLKPTNRQAIEALVSPFGVALDWRSDVIDLDKVRFRDGNIVLDEMRRLAVENGHSFYETADGRVRFVDGPTGETGEDLVLGVNILSFSAEQSEETAHSDVTVKGQRSAADVWGEAALVDRYKKVVDQTVGAFSPIIVQHYGDATDEQLERRGRFEMNRRNADAKSITVEVFHVQSRSGLPWDIGTMHYVEIPTEGIFDVMECTELEYTVDTSTLTTKLTLSPIPAASQASSGLASFSSWLTQRQAFGTARRVDAGLGYTAGQWPGTWGGPSLVLGVVSNAIVRAVKTGLAAFLGD